MTWPKESHEVGNATDRILDLEGIEQSGSDRLGCQSMGELPKRKTMTGGTESNTVTPPEPVNSSRTRFHIVFEKSKT